MLNAYLYDGLRSPIGRHAGGLAGVRPDDLLAGVMKELMARSSFKPEQLEDLVIGCANQGGEDSRCVARHAGLLAGLPIEVGGTVLQRNCASGLNAVAYAAQVVTAGEGDLFLAGVIPGFIMGFALMAMIYWMAVTGRIVAPVQPRANLAEVRRTFVAAFPALLAPIILCGGIVIGVATPTELGALTVVYAIALGFWQRELTWTDIWDAAAETLVTYGVLVLIIAAAVPFGWVVAVTEAPQKLAELLFAISQNKWVILGIINVLLLIAGCFMETTAILLIATPTLLPLVKQLGVNEVHFGLMMIINLLIGALTPPFGVLLFITMDIAKVSFGAIVRAIMPFYLPLVVVLLLVTYWPDMVMFLPNLFKD